MASDFSAIHQVRDVTALPGPVFFKFAFRLAAYKSVMRARVEDAIAEETAAGDSPSARQAPDVNPASRRGVTHVPATRVALQAHPQLSQIISFG